MTSADPVSVLSLLRELAAWVDSADYAIDSFEHPALDVARAVTEITDAVPVLIAALEAVLDLHTEIRVPISGGAITGSDGITKSVEPMYRSQCLHCFGRSPIFGATTWPCQTRRVVSENLSALTNQEQR